MIDVYHIHQSAGFLLLAIFISILSWRWVSFPFASAVFVTLFSALNPIAPSISSMSAFATVAILVLLMPAPRFVNRALAAVFIILTANCFLVLIYGYGIFNAGSVDNTMLALIVPFAFFHDERPRLYEFFLISLFILTVVLTQGSTAYMVIAAELGLYLFLKRHYFALSAALLACLGAGWYFQGAAFLDSNGRLEHWKLFFDWWKVNANHLIGTGTGSFYWLGPAIQGQKPPLFTFMHNDILQALFEQGFLGLGIYVVLFLDCLRRSLSRPWLAATFLGIAVASLTQYPFRLFLSQVMILLFIRGAHDSGPREAFRKRA